MKIHRASMGSSRRPTAYRGPIAFQKVFLGIWHFEVPFIPYICSFRAFLFSKGVSSPTLKLGGGAGDNDHNDNSNASFLIDGDERPEEEEVAADFDKYGKEDLTWDHCCFVGTTPQ